MNAQTTERAEAAHGNLRWKDLLGLGWSERQIRHRIDTGWLVVVHDGVVALGHRQRTSQSRWKAATMTTPTTTLFAASAGGLYELWEDPEHFVVVVRPGSGGPKRYDGLLVCRSTLLPGDAAVVDGIPVTGVARTIVDLAPHCGEKGMRRLVRDALRRELTTPAELWAVLDRHRGRRGTGELRKAAQRYCALPRIRKAMSDPEVVAQELLAAVGRSPSRTNARVAGHEADLIWDREKLIVELDSRRWHAFSPEDAEKDEAWTAAGFTVHRLPTDDVYTRPERLIALSVHPPSAADGG